MKTQFFTRNLCLGVLMALVLTFSVQGIADAQTYTEKSGDHQFASPGNNLGSPLVFTVTDIEAVETETDEFSTPGTEFNITAAAGVTIRSIKVGSKSNHNVNSGEVKLLTPADYTYAPATDPPDEETADAKKERLAAEKAAKKVQDEAEKDHNDLRNTLKSGSNTISVYCRVDSTGGTGVFTVTVGSNDLIFTVYGANNDVAGVEFNPESPDADGEHYNIIRYSAEGDISLASSDFNNDIAAGHLIDFTVISGSGRLYFDNDDRSKAQSKQTVGVDTNTASIRFRPPSSGVTIVEAWIRGTNQRRRWTFFSSSPTLHKVDEVSAESRTGVINTRLLEPLTIEVRDGSRSSGVPGQKVKFSLTDSSDSATTDTLLVDASDANNTGVAEITLRSGDRGRAGVYLTLGATEGTYDLDVTLTDDADVSWDRERFIVKAVDEIADAIIEKVSGDKERVDPESGAHPSQLIVQVLNRNRRIVEGSAVTFRATVGTVTGNPNARPTDPDDNAIFIGASEGQFVTQLTDEYGRAAVTFVIGDTSGDAQVRVVINPATQHEQAVTFTIYGRGGAPAPPREREERPTAPPAQPPSLSADISGAPGSQQTLSVSTSSLAEVRVGNALDSFITAGGRVLRPTFTGSRAVAIILPNTIGDYSLTVTATVAGLTTTDRRTIRVVEADNGAGIQTGTRGTLEIQTDVTGRPGDSRTVTVTATNTNRTPAANVVVRLRVTSGGGSFSPASITTGANGTASTIFTRGSTVGSSYFISATTTPSGYNTTDSRGVRITISRTGTTPPTPPTTGDADALGAYDGGNQIGALNTPLPEPLVVEVVDANDNPVENVRVRFRTTIGSGRFSPRTPRTGRDGFAETTFTPTSPGRVRVVATISGVSGTAAFIITAGETPESLTKVSGDNQSGTPGNALANPFVVEVKDEDGDPIAGIRVSFSVTAGGGSLSETSAVATANGRAQTTLTLGSEPGVNSVQASVPGVDPVTFSTSVEAKILVAAANRPVMYWIAGGALYRLSGAKEAKIAESANGVAVGGSKIYWTATTGASSGSINSANLDGTDMTTLTSILAVPMGIAVDTAGSKLYWTNARGRIQSANLNGSGIKNVLQNLSDPTDIVVSNGFIYWTEGGNSIRRVNMSGQKIARDVAANLDTVGGLAVGGGKVYWTEQTSASAGTVNGANLNGTNFETLATLLSAPMGIAVDTAGSKLYWTNARGRVQSANLDGSRIKNVVEGLISASKLVIGGANTAEAVTKQPTQPTKKDTSAYDVNGDGKVNNVDASLVASGLDTGDAKYDVNKDGAVNFLDLLLVFDNRDDNAAAAPTIVGMKLSAVQIDRIQEQIDLLIATNDRSPAALRTLVYLQQLLVTARPEKTQLLANYPNPFNPETWIPYELATDTRVEITIYNTQGVVIRRLQLGQQSAGYYTDRDRAAYWDGRNALGEQVASGLYFYQLETDSMSSMRKMVILK